MNEPADDGWVAAEAGAPQGIAQHHDTLAPRVILVEREGAAQRW